MSWCNPNCGLQMPHSTAQLSHGAMWLVALSTMHRIEPLRCCCVHLPHKIFTSTIRHTHILTLCVCMCSFVSVSVCEDVCGWVYMCVPFTFIPIGHHLSNPPSNRDKWMPSKASSPIRAHQLQLYFSFIPSAI